MNERLTNIGAAGKLFQPLHCTESNARVFVVIECLDQRALDVFVLRSWSKHFDCTQSEARICGIIQGTDQKLFYRFVAQRPLNAQRLNDFTRQFDLAGGRISTYDMKI